MEREKNNTHLWYVGYGSNLCFERFYHYICGGKFRLGGKCCTGCRDKTFLGLSKPFKIPHCLYFANKANGWKDGGVAFISLKPEPDKSQRFSFECKIEHAKAAENEIQLANQDFARCQQV